MKPYLYKLLIICVITITSSYSQEFVPPIQNYSPAEYAAASQNWDIALDERGVVYAANNQGLLVFDGVNWELFPLESRSIIRSVYPYNGKVFIGSYQEFGYWETTDEGCMNYVSLTSLMKDIDMQSDEFWEITSYNDAIYFRSFGAVYKYQDNKISKIEEIVSTAMGNYKDQLILAPRKNGLVSLDVSGKLTPLEGNLDVIMNINVIDIESAGDTLYIGGKEGLYYYANNKVRRFWDNELNEFLQKSELNHIISVSDNELVLGTIKNGIVHYDISGSTYHVYNRASGLQNNTVLGMAYARDKLWLALDKGVDYVDLHEPIKFYTDNTGEVGAVYDLQIYRGEYYLASNTGVYRIGNSGPELIENATDHTWNLEVIDNTLYANHNTGTYKIVNNSFVPIDNRTGSFVIKKLKENDKYLIGHYTGLSLFDPGNAELEVLEEINFPVKEIVFEGDDKIWAAHPYEGLYRITTDGWEEFEIEKVSPLGDSKNFSPKIYKVNDQILTYIDEKWYKYNPFTQTFERSKELASYDHSRLVYKGDSEYIFINTLEGSLVITDLKDEQFSIPAQKLNNRMVKGNENLVRLNDSIFYVTLNDGFARLNLNRLRRQREAEWISAPFIKEFSDEIERYSLKDPAAIPYKQSRNITIKAGMPVSEAGEVIYELKGEESLSGIVTGGEINFRNLKHGDYELQLKAAGENMNKTLPAEILYFSIAPPWYFSVWMKAVYVLFLILIFLFIYWVNKQKLKKHQLQLEEKFEKEHSERLNMLEKQRLMNEIDLKRKELANTTMMAAKKNEVLMEIQGELSKDKNKFSNQFRIKHIMNKINTAVKNKDEWKVFETNFNEVHEDFFKDLLKRYPKLTSKDLKLCSYLKMNLSSKEIAPLMGISVRGVEVHRYRLRKKMKLDSDVNLTKFLIKNF
ncbi:LuxR C-terminal-related transcriptional regulator [Gramella sp. KN1008]|uniref:helix-turn-helix and ligand-binding sensor domain-containing protein n=1 Tax=Gramella sp. KN1008 TaxID=2529298 RepID=UPI0010387014|nr:LuxR C-terminal-related transcriptional regulator [Gramella sp. KN1008]TBW30347.1 histidine kinase [Gramella sp. KN1008]